MRVIDTILHVKTGELNANVLIADVSLENAISWPEMTDIINILLYP